MVDSVSTSVKEAESKVDEGSAPREILPKFECDATLQVVDVRNITKPTRAILDVEQQSKKQPNRTLVITLSDGTNKCRCIELTPLQVLNKVLPGMEVKLKGRIPVNSGFLVLQEDNIEIVGGPIDRLVREWRAAQNRAIALCNASGTSAPVFQALTKEMLEQKQRQPRQQQQQQQQQFKFGDFTPSKQLQQQQTTGAEQKPAATEPAAPITAKEEQRIPTEKKTPETEKTGDEQKPVEQQKIRIERKSQAQQQQQPSRKSEGRRGDDKKKGHGKGAPAAAEPSSTESMPVVVVVVEDTKSTPAPPPQKQQKQKQQEERPKLRIEKPHNAPPRQQQQQQQEHKLSIVRPGTTTATAPPASNPKKLSIVRQQDHQ